LQLVDDNLRKANVKSRNDFVEKAIEYYAGCLNAEQNREYMGGVLSSDLEILFSKFAKPSAPTNTNLRCSCQRSAT